MYVLFPLLHSYALVYCTVLPSSTVLGQSCPPEGVQYFPDNEQCDKYYECRNGVGSEKLCPDGLLFNDQITDGRYPCFYPPEVDCGSRSRTREYQS